MKQKTKDIIGALLLGLLCTLALSAVITVADTETARTDLMIGMQYETTGLDLDAAPGLLVGLVKLHQNFPLDAWAWGPAAAGLAALLYWGAPPAHGQAQMRRTGAEHRLWCRRGAGPEHLQAGQLGLRL